MRQGTKQQSTIRPFNVKQDETLQRVKRWVFVSRENRRLAVFVGGCTLEAVEAVSTALGDGAANVLDTVTSLIDKSLIQQREQEDGELRLLMLEMIREYALECLETSGEAEAARCAYAICISRHDKVSCI